MRQESLFQYPNYPGHKVRDTSKAAADAIAPKAQTMRDKCYQVLRTREMSADEVAEVLEISVLSSRPRIAELAAMGKIEDTGRRVLNGSKSRVIVWRIK